MELMEKELDASAEQTKGHPWLTVYQQAARDALSGYLGSSKEQDFDQLTDIISRFKRGDTHIWLKRMGRTPEALWYEKVDFSQVSVLIIEWTHGNSEKYQGVATFAYCMEKISYLYFPFGVQIHRYLLSLYFLLSYICFSFPNIEPFFIL